MKKVISVLIMSAALSAFAQDKTCYEALNPESLIVSSKTRTQKGIYAEAIKRENVSYAEESDGFMTREVKTSIELRVQTKNLKFKTTAFENGIQSVGVECDGGTIQFLESEDADQSILTLGSGSLSGFVRAGILPSCKNGNVKISPTSFKKVACKN